MSKKNQENNGYSTPENEPPEKEAAAGEASAGSYSPERELAKHSGIKMRLIDGFKGLIIGATMSVPGASGGTMAILLGIYDDMIGAVSSLRRNFKKSFLFLLVLLIGGFIGLLCMT